MITIQRVREYVGAGGAAPGTAVFLVDGLWPRGVPKAALDVPWLKDVAPSAELRAWFGHRPERWEEFGRRYRQELDHDPAAEQLLEAAAAGPELLLFDAKDTEHNQAVVLADWLRDHRLVRR